MSLIVGIDPGLTGAIAALHADGTIAWIEDMPIAEHKNAAGKQRNKVDSAELFAMLLAREVEEIIGCVALEIQQPMRRKNKKTGVEESQGSSSTGRLMEGYGMIQGVLGSLKIKPVFVRPQAWRKHHLLEPGKDPSLTRARQLWPECLLLDRKKDHGRADALLIAEWGRTHQNGNAPRGKDCET